MGRSIRYLISRATWDYHDVLFSFIFRNPVVMTDYSDLNFIPSLSEFQEIEEAPRLVLQREFFNT